MIATKLSVIGTSLSPRRVFGLQGVNILSGLDADDRFGALQEHIHTGAQM